MLVGQTYLTLADLKKRQNAAGDFVDIVELMSQTNPIMQDMIVSEANDGMTHLTAQRTGLPEPVFRKLYQGVQPSRSQTQTLRDACGMLEAWSEVDSKLVDIAVDKAKFRLQEAIAHLEAMNQSMARRTFYGSTVGEPSEFLGLAPRFSDTSSQYGQQIVKAGGTDANNTSVWFVVWGERTVGGFYPRGSQGGLKREDRGVQTTKDDKGGLYDVYREKFSWDLGMYVSDYRYVSRIANIDIGALRAGTVDLYKFMRSAYYKLHQRIVTGGRAAIYCNRDVLEALDAIATNAGANDSFVRLTPKEIEGKEVQTYRGIPVRECDALMNTEEAVA